MPPAPDRRRFLPWHRPLLPQAVELLAGSWAGSGPLDLSRVVVVVPTRQAGRRLREALADHAARRNQGVFAPRVLTPDALLTLEPDPKTATRLDSLLAWIAVLRDLPLEQVRDVFPVDPPVRNFTWALRLAREFTGLQRALAEAGLRIDEVPARFGDGYAERPRWRQLGVLEQFHATELLRAGRHDETVARIEAARNPRLANFVRVVVIATPDPMPLALAALEQLEKTLPVTVAVFAPESEREAFDAWGRPAVEAWARREVTLPEFESHVHLAADPADQAARLAGIARNYRPPEGAVALGVADPEILPPLESSLRDGGLGSFNPEGRSRDRVGLFHLLSALAALLTDPSYDAVGRLARCPDFIAYLAGKRPGEFSAARWLDGLDRLREKHLPADLAAALQAATKPGVPPEVTAGLRAMDDTRRALQDGTFGESTSAVLAEIFRERAIDLRGGADVQLEEAAEAWTACVRECVQAEEKFGSLAAEEWWGLALQVFAEGVVTEEKAEGALELQGWLELVWENAPHLVVAGLNDGRVPDAVVGDPFLPETLRARLGLKTNAARLARDAYLLQALAASRAGGGRLDLFYGKTSASGEPLRPSRLLLHCPDPELPKRVEYLFRAPEKRDQSIPWTRAWRLKPRHEPAPHRVAVTGLREWLKCPFRFYFSQVLKMRSVDPSKRELDSLDFGTLCHGALEGLGGPGLRDCADEPTLKNFLLSEFDRVMSARFGDDRSLPLLIQQESARQRLAKVAEIQARERSEGWVIVAVERPFELDCGGLTVRGRIDRIERHEKTGMVRVLDYKTSDTAVEPRDVHWRAPYADESSPDWARLTVEGRERIWADLQLPLYRQALAVEFGPAVRAGYFNLPKATGETGLALWDDFTPELQAAAWRCAEGVCRSIKAGIFWPPNEHVKEEWDDYAAMFMRGPTASVEWEVAR